MRQIMAGVGLAPTMSAELNCRDRRLLAFRRTAANVAGTASLKTILDALIAEFGAAANVDTALVIAEVERGADTEALIGGFGEPPGLRAAAAALCQGDGPLKAGVGPRVFRHLPQLVAVDERFAPIAAFVAAAGWDTLVAMPLTARGHPVGFLLAWYSPGREPGDAETAFLAAMGDQAAIAINTARLELRVR